MSYTPRGDSAVAPPMTTPTSSLRVRCTVRGCDQELLCDGKTWRCARGHSFDVARSGYVNLLQPNDRRSAEPGDSRAAVEARFRLEERGIGERQAAALASFVAPLLARSNSVAVDVGAGTGLQLARLCGEQGWEGCALELSRRACDLGARARPELRWIAANGDRVLPLFDASVGLVVSSVGPKNPEEFRRVLAPGGALVLVLSGEEDLIELRAAVQGAGTRIDRVTPTLERFAPWFTCVRRAGVRARVLLERPELEDVLASTYRGARPRERDRMAALEALDLTFTAELLHLEPRDPGPHA